MARIKQIVNKLLMRISPVLIIKNSDLFDEKWYKDNYHINANYAARHYLLEGYKLGYNPSNKFDSNLYKELYPDTMDMNPLLHYELYGRIEQRTISNEEVETGLFEINEIIGNLDDKKSTLIYVDLYQKKDSKSGAQDYSYKRIDELSINNNVILFKYKQWSNNWLVGFDDDNLNSVCFNELANICDRVRVNKLVINNLAYNNKIEKVIAEFIRIKELYNFEIVYEFHDYFSLCPSSFLLNSSNLPCANYCGNECNECLINNRNSIIKRSDINEWRKCFDDLFDVTDKFIFFSNYSKNIVSSVYPKTKNGEVKEHECLLNEYASKYIRPIKNEILRIAFVGNYCYPKGAKIFEEVISMLRKEYRIKPYIIGYSSINVPKDYIVTGKYNRNDLGKILTDNMIDYVIYPSIDNETFSYVAEELMYLKVPFVLFECGAPAERVIKRRYNKAIIAQQTTSESLYKALKELITKDER